MHYEDRSFTPDAAEGETPEPKPYEAPQVENLGSLLAMTGGPSAGSSDALIGAAGGFPTTS